MPNIKEKFMRDFIRNLILLAFIALIIFLMFPQMMSQVAGIYGGLGILVPFILLVVLLALPSKKNAINTSDTCEVTLLAAKTISIRVTRAG